MKILNKNKIGLAIGLALTLTTASQGQWATFNVSDALYDYFRSMRDYVQNSNLQVISNGQQLQMAQAAQNVVNADYRNRLATVYNNILQEDDRQRPTWATCIEQSKGQVAVASVAASINGGRRSGGSAGGAGRTKGADATKNDYAVDDPVKIQSNIRSTENAQAMVLINMKESQTCSPKYGSTLCGGTPAEYALADVSVFGLLSNSANSEKLNKEYNLANYTMKPAAYKAALQYVNVATLANAPKYPDTSEIQKNPLYVAMYNSMIIKLNAAAESLTSLADLRKAPTTVNSAITSVWSSADTTSDWKTIFPTLRQPEAPSFYEFMNFRAYSDVFGPATIKNANNGKDIDVLKGIQSKIALNNLIAWQQYNQQEKTNILLSHILVQLSTPANKDLLDKEYQKFNQK